METDSQAGFDEADRYKRIQAAFLEARDMDADERTRWLTEMPDQDLASEVKSLLEFDQPDETQLLASTERAESLGIQTQSPDAGAHPTSTAGPFTLHEVLGQGGFGTVYRATQITPLRREVAVKLIRPGMGSASVLARFDAERHTLAMLNHSGIASVLDAGETDQGIPFFAMELVDGLPLDQFCDRHGLSVDARIELIGQACQAVDHAHRRGILHRDLKPSNVLAYFDDCGTARIKVIDFGIAKALQPDHPSGAVSTDQSTVTQQGQMLGTLEYMSPEQASMDSRQLDTRTDIYSLGAMLFKLLTGEPPITRDQLLSGGYWKIYATIRDASIRRPSSLADLPSEDLDWIVIKALQKDRDARYATVHAFVRDLERFQNHESIEARPPSIVYQTRMLVRRHRLVVASMVAITAALILGVVGLIFGLRKAQVARDDALQQSDRATSLNDQLNRTLYTISIESAWESAREKNIDKARRLLDQTPVSLRSFEWQLVDRQIRQASPSKIRPRGKAATKQLDCLGTKTLCVTDDGRVTASDLGSDPAWTFKDTKRATAARWCPLSDGQPQKEQRGEAGNSLDVVIGFYDGSICRIAPTGKVVAQSDWSRRGGIYDLATTSNDRLAVCFGDTGVLLCDLHTLSIQREWMIPARMSSLAFDSTAEVLVGCGLDGRLYRFDVDTKYPAVIEGQDRFSMPYVLAWQWIGPDEGIALSKEAVSHVRLNDTEAQLVRSIALDSAAGWNVMHAIDSQRFLIGNGAGQLQQIEWSKTPATVASGSSESVSQTVYRFDSAIRDLNFDSKNGSPVVALSDGFVAKLDSRDSAETRDLSTDPLRLTSTLTAACVLEFENRVATLDVDGNLTLWDIASGKRIVTASAHKGAGWELIATDDRLLTVGDDQRIAAWDRNDLSSIWDRTVGWGVRGIASAADNSWVAAGPAPSGDAGEGTIGIYDSAGQPVGQLVGHDNWVVGMAVDANGKRLISSCENRTIRIWDIDEARQIAKLVSPKQSVSEHLVILDGNENAPGRLITGHRDGQLLVWDLSTQQPVCNEAAFGDAITGLNVIANRIVVSGQSSNRVKVFDRETARPIATLPIEGPGIRAMLVAAKQKWIVVNQDTQVSAFRW